MGDTDDVLDRPAGPWSALRRDAPAARPSGARSDNQDGASTGAMLDDAIPESSKYQAFKAVDGNLFCLGIYAPGGPCPADADAAYQYYQYMLNDRTGKIFDIVFGFFVVRVRGRNLQPVIRAIKSKKCAFIQQYQRRDEWPTPEKNDTVIEKIEIIFKPEERTALLSKG